jgi:hypothetical protein
MELLLGALAEAIITILIEDLSQRPRLAALRDKLRGDSPEKLALHYALAQSYRAFVAQYPQLAHAFFDQHFLQQPAVAGELAKLLTPQQTPDAATLAQLWQAQFHAPPALDIANELAFFLTTLADAIQSQPALKPFTDSRAFAQLYRIAERADRQIDEQQRTNHHLQAIHQLLAEVARQIVAQPTQVQIQSDGGAVVQGDANAGQDVVLRDKVINVYNFFDRPPSATTAVQSLPSSFTHLTNPFTSRGRINEPQLFAGRQRILRELQGALANGNSIALIGASETGKSSLLYYLYNTRQDWLPSHAVIYLDLQGVIDEIDFCAEILQVLDPLQQGKQRTGKEALRALKQAMRGRKVLLLMDEVERLAQRRDFTARLQDLLRALCQEEQTLTLLAACEHPLDRIFPPSHDTSPLHNVFSSLDLPNFTAEETVAFLHHRLAPTGLTFDDQELREIWATTGGHPGQVQRAAEALFNRKVGTH